MLIKPISPIFNINKKKGNKTRVKTEFKDVLEQKVGDNDSNKQRRDTRCETGPQSA